MEKMEESCFLWHKRTVPLGTLIISKQLITLVNKPLPKCL